MKYAIIITIGTALWSSACVKFTLSNHKYLWFAKLKARFYLHFYPYRMAEIVISN